MNIHYIAGFFDGEGSVYSSIKAKKMQLAISVGSNTDIEVLERIAATLREFDIETRLHLQKTKNGTLAGNLKPVDLDNMLKFLSLIEPFIFIKHHVVMLAKKYLQSRLTDADKFRTNEEKLLLLQINELTYAGRKS